jgi:hypothetical protein
MDARREVTATHEIPTAARKAESKRDAYIYKDYKYLFLKHCILFEDIYSRSIVKPASHPHLEKCFIRSIPNNCIKSLSTTAAGRAPFWR